METTACYIHGDKDTYDAASVKIIGNLLRQAAVAVGVPVEAYSLRYAENSDLFILSCPSLYGGELNNCLSKILVSMGGQDQYSDATSSPASSAAETYFSAMPEQNSTRASPVLEAGSTNAVSENNEQQQPPLNIATLLGHDRTAMHTHHDDTDDVVTSLHPLDIDALLGNAPSRGTASETDRDYSVASETTSSFARPSIQLYDTVSYNKFDRFGLKGHAENTAKWEVQMGALSVNDLPYTIARQRMVPVIEDMTVEPQPWSQTMVPPSTATTTGELIDVDLGIGSHISWPALSEPTQPVSSAQDHAVLHTPHSEADVSDLIDLNSPDEQTAAALASDENTLPSQLKGKRQQAKRAWRNMAL